MGHDWVLDLHSGGQNKLPRSSKIILLRKGMLHPLRHKSIEIVYELGKSLNEENSLLQMRKNWKKK